MPQVILKEQLIQPATLFLQEILINIKTRHFHSSINHQEHLFHRTLYHQLLSSYEYCKVFKNSFFIEHLQKQSFADVLQNRCSKQFRKLHRKALVLEFLFKKLAGRRLANLFKKDSNTGVFRKVCEIFKNTFVYRHLR